MKQNDLFIKIRSLIKLLFLAFGIIITTTVVAQDVTTGLILNYTFDAVSGTTVTDDSGSGNVGTLNGAMITPVEGYSGQGVQGLIKDDYITLPANINSTLTSFTFSTWVKLSALKNATRFFDFGNGANATNDFLSFIPSYNGDNGFMCLRFRPASGTAYNVLSTSKIPIGVWAHVALTGSWDGTNREIKIFLNGVVVGSGTMPVNPSTLGATADNYVAYSRWTQDTNGFNGILDDVRFYNRALTSTDILTMNGLSELYKQYNNLTLGDISAVTSNLTLPTVAGTNGVTIVWNSSKPSVLDSLGVVNRPAKYDATVSLTASLTQEVSGKIYTLTKVFTAKVLALEATPEQVAEWTFEPSSISFENDTIRVVDVLSGFKGSVLNDARIRTIGSTDKYNVLDLGNGKGYFDMGKEIGQAVYSLSDYTIMTYFRVDDSYTELGAGGNFLYAFSNTDYGDVGRNGYVIGRLNNTSHQCTKGYWGSGKMEIAAGTVAPQGAWHHYAYVQEGTTGTIYLDGAVVATGTMTNLPGTSIALAGRDGTLFNWIGRSIGLSSDVYLRKTLVYDFQLLTIPVTADDINFGIFEVPVTLDKLNVAYGENPDYVAPELNTEMENLSLGDLSAVTSNITLPKKGTIDDQISITWKSTNSALIDENGVVTRPDFYNYNDTLTAVLTKNGQRVTKSFPATVLMKEGSAFNNDLLVKYDFSAVADSVVTDAAEKHFSGVLKNNAKVRTIGTTVQYNVLSLGDSTSYFDLGPEIGKLMYNLNDYTLSAFYRIDTSYTELANNGNFLWNFSNSADANKDRNGYVFASLGKQNISISPKFYDSATGNQALSFANPAIQGDWHHFAYVQNGLLGTIYVDGIGVMSGDITNLPSQVLPKNGRLGTLYNWLGRSCYAGDNYLMKTLIADFRLYKKALTDSEILLTELNVVDKIAALNMAIDETPNSLKSLFNSPYKVYSVDGIIKISGLKGGEKISVFDISGRKTNFNNSLNIKLNSGIYIVRINEYASKIIVK